MDDDDGVVVYSTMVESTLSGGKAPGTLEMSRLAAVFLCFFVSGCIRVVVVLSLNVK